MDMNENEIENVDFKMLVQLRCMDLEERME